MVIVILTTLAAPGVLSFTWIIAGILIGGAVGAVVARSINMTALPQLVAAFHWLVGLAAVLVAGAAFTNPEAYHIGTPGNIHGGSLMEMAWAWPSARSPSAVRSSPSPSCKAW